MPGSVLIMIPINLILPLEKTPSTWAFSHPFFSAVTTTTVTNPALNRVLEKVGAQIVSLDEKSTNWIIQRGVG